MIKHVHGQYVLFTSDGSRVLGKHPTKAAAEAQETAISLSKARKEGKKVPPAKGKT